MQVPFSDRPGRHERHFRRKLGNRLMPRPGPDDYSKDELLEVQRLDHEELLDFLTRLRQLVQQAVQLQPREETQVVLDLKAELEKMYEMACGLADKQDNNKAALQQLIGVIMANIGNSAGSDALAAQELAQEETARTHHFALLEQPLIADLLHPESLIAVDELAPVLLTDDEVEVAEALNLFDQAQLTEIYNNAADLLQAAGLLDEYAQRLEMLRGDLALS